MTLGSLREEGEGEGGVEGCSMEVYEFDYGEYRVWLFKQPCAASSMYRQKRRKITLHARRRRYDSLPVGMTQSVNIQNVPGKRAGKAEWGT